VSRFLFVVPPLVGHVNPLVGVAARLREQGHEVAWAGEPELVRSLAGAHAQVFCAHGPDVLDRIRDRPAGLRGFAALQFLWEEVFVPLADDGVDRVSRAVTAFAPDVVLADQQTLAGALAALRHRLPWATSASTGAEFVDPLAVTPRIAQWRSDLLTGLLRRHVPELAAGAEVAGAEAAGAESAGAEVAGAEAAGAESAGAEVAGAESAGAEVAGAESAGAESAGAESAGAEVAGAEVAGEPVPDLYVSPHLVLAFTTEALVGAGRAPAQTVFVGPSLAHRPAPDGFPWHALREDRPVVLVTLGTVNSEAGDRFLAECAAAGRLLTVPAQLVVVDPGGTLPACVEPGADTLVLRHVPQLHLLSRVSAVVCHAGHNTVCESLDAGVPLVLAPIRDDQPTVAQQVVDAGAGVRVRFARVSAPQLAAAVEQVLREPGYAAAATRIKRSFELAGGAFRAAETLVRLARPASRGEAMALVP
jgi:MGT family glycosyltransferase